MKTCDELGYRFDICVFEDGAPILPSSVRSIQGTVIQNQQFQFGKPAILEQSTQINKLEHVQSLQA